MEGFYIKRSTPGEETSFRRYRGVTGYFLQVQRLGLDREWLRGRKGRQ